MSEREAAFPSCFIRNTGAHFLQHMLQSHLQYASILKSSVDSLAYVPTCLGFRASGQGVWIVFDMACACPQLTCISLSDPALPA
jgi:hypothetical protein